MSNLTTLSVDGLETTRVSLKPEEYVPVMEYIYNVHLNILSKRLGQDSSMTKMSVFLYNKVSKEHNDQKYPDILEFDLNSFEFMQFGVALNLFITTSKAFVEGSVEREEYENAEFVNNLIHKAESMMKCVESACGRSVKVTFVDQNYA